MTWHHTGDKPLSESIAPNLLTHICISRPSLRESIPRLLNEGSTAMTAYCAPSQSNPRGSGPEVLKRERGHVTAATGVAVVVVFGALQRNDNAWVTAGCQTLSWTNADLSPRNEHELDPNLCVFIEHYYIRKPVCGHWIYPLQIESKQTLFYVPWTVKDRTHGPALRSGFASGHRVALVVLRAQKSVRVSAGEWPTFLPPALESCSGTANVDGPNWDFRKFWLKSRLPGNFDQNRDFWKFWLKSLFSNILTKIEICENFDQNWEFSKVLTIIEIFRKFRAKSRFLKILSITEILKNFDQNRNYSKILTKIGISLKILIKIQTLRKFQPKLIFWKILTKIECNHSMIDCVPSYATLA